jgi:hypothetical protein
MARLGYPAATISRENYHYSHSLAHGNDQLTFGQGVVLVAISLLDGIPCPDRSRYQQAGGSYIRSVSHGGSISM